MSKYVTHDRMAERKLSYVIDASVILKWFLEKEEYRQEAMVLRDLHREKKIDLCIPDYALAEVSNILGCQLPRDRNLYFFSILLQFELCEYRLTVETVGIAMDIMKSIPGVSFYDAGYHAVALCEGMTFITADKKYYSLARRKGNIMLLKDYGKKK